MLTHLKALPGRDDQQRVRARERAMHRLLCERGVLPEHLRESPADFSDFAVQNPELPAIGMRLVAGSSAGLLLKGGAGRGKSRFVVAIFRAQLLAAASDATRAAATGFRVLSVRALLDDVWAAPFERRRDVLARYEKLPLLALEDLGLEGTAGESAVEILHGLLTVRNGFERPTIVTTNLPFASTRSEVVSVESRYGETIASRLSVWTHYTMLGPDRRRA